MGEQRISSKLPELLAPAGSMEALGAAVAAGADSVYLGGKQFGARRFARNFDEKEMGEAISYAHLFGVKVYITINTLIHDRELADLARYLLRIYQMGADAILVQDSGVASLVKALLPDLPIHASTQCTIASIQGVLWAKKKGFGRVVLSREVTLPELDRILALPNENRTGIEIFVHGALCYCYSGQCLLSSVIGGRSGNRGMCAQPCRKPYQLVTGKTDQYGRPAEIQNLALKDQYLLSTRDLCLYPQIGDIAGRTIDALKIEGRMRSPDYVSVTVSAYREALDSASKGDFIASDEVLRDLAIAFNRGFTRGYLMGERGSLLMGRTRPDPCGLLIGTVITCNRDRSEFAIRPATGRIPQTGDGLVLINPRSGEETGFIQKGRVRSCDGILHFIEQVDCTKGMELYLTRSARLERKITAISRRKVVTKRHPIPIDITLTLVCDKRPVIYGSFAGHNGSIKEVKLTAEFVAGMARDRPTTSDEIEHQVRKTGESHFRVRNFQIFSEGDLFIPIGPLNKFRRDFLAYAETDYLTTWLPEEHQVEQAHGRLSNTLGALENLLHSIPPGNQPSHEIAVYANDLDTIREACKAGCHRVYFEISGNKEYLWGSLEEAKEICNSYNVALVWKWPWIVTDRFVNPALSLISRLAAIGIDGIMVEGFGLAEVIVERDSRMEVFGGIGLNVFNHLSVHALTPPFHRLTLSPELSASDIATLIACTRKMGLDTPLEVVVQGNLEAMISEDDLLGMLPGEIDVKKHNSERFFGIRDERGRVFPVMRDDLGKTRISNSVETCLIDYIPDLIEMGVNSFSLDARGRGAVYAAFMVALYKDAMVRSSQAKDREKLRVSLKILKEKVKDASWGGLTAGSFREGLVDE